MFSLKIFNFSFNEKLGPKRETRVDKVSFDAFLNKFTLRNNKKKYFLLEKLPQFDGKIAKKFPGDFREFPGMKLFSR